MRPLPSANPVLFWFGMLNFVLAAIFALLALYKPFLLVGVNAWFKPLKFALSIGIYVWTLGYYSRYLPAGVDLRAFNWTLVISLGFEIIYIGLQAGRGQLSHFNVGTPLYSFLYFLMALGASVATLAGAWLGYQLTRSDLSSSDPAFLASLQVGIAIFVVFAFQGFSMGSRLSHSVGGADGTTGLPFLNWSRSIGDLRAAHFFGMHALQIVPFLSYLMIRSVRGVVVFGVVYFLAVGAIYFRALSGRPLIP